MTETLTDKDIIAGFLKGKTGEYSIICGWIQEILRTQLWDGSISPDDIESCAIVKLLDNLRTDRFEYRSSLKAYVQCITRYTLIDAVRSSRRVVTLPQIDPPDERNNPHQIVEAAQEHDFFDRIMNMINWKCRQLWTMIFDERLSYREIARKLHISEGTVKTRVFRCKEQAIAIRKKIT